MRKSFLFLAALLLAVVCAVSGALALEISGQPANTTAAVSQTVSFHVEATGDGLTYQWQTKLTPTSAWANTGLTGNKTATLTFSVGNASFDGRQYRCIVTAADGTRLESGAATLTVPTLSISNQPTSVTVVKGGTATFTVVASGTGLTYQWQAKNSAAAAWANTGLGGNKTATLSFTVPNSSADYNGRQYRCIVTDATGSRLTSNAVTLTVKPAVAIQTQPADATSVVGKTVSFHVSATGDGLTYQWQTKLNASAAWANTGLTGAKTDTLSFAVGNTAYDGRQYRCIVTDKSGAQATSSAATLILIKLTISGQPTDVVSVVGKTASFHVEASGDGLTYQWQTKLNASAAWANTGLTGAKTDTLSFAVGNAAYNGRQYRCIVTDKSGAQATSSAATLVLSNMTVQTQPTDVTSAVGKTVSFHMGVTGDGLTYQWQTKLNATSAWANTGLTGNKTATLTFSVGNASFDGRQYRCVVTDAIGYRVESNPATLKFMKPEIKTQPADVISTVGKTASFHVEAIGDGLTYQWQTKLNASAAWANTGLTGAKTDTLTFAVGNAAYDGRQYRCVVTDASGNQEASDAATLSLSTVEITVQPEEAHGMLTQRVSYHVEATGLNLTYRWQMKPRNTDTWQNTLDAGYNTDTLTVVIGDENDDRRQYRCIITDGAGNECTSDEADLIVVGEPYLMLFARYDDSAALSDGWLTLRPYEQSSVGGIYIYQREVFPVKEDGIYSYWNTYTDVIFDQVTFNHAAMPYGLTYELVHRSDEQDVRYIDNNDMTNVRGIDFYIRDEANYSDSIMDITPLFTYTYTHPLTGESITGEVNMHLLPAQRISYIDANYATSAWIRYKDDEALFSYIPDCSGTYTFYAYADEPVACSLYDKFMQLNQLANSHQMTCHLEAGEEYTFGVKYRTTDDLSGIFTVYLESEDHPDSVIVEKESGYAGVNITDFGQQVYLTCTPTLSGTYELSTDSENEVHAVVIENGEEISFGTIHHSDEDKGASLTFDLVGGHEYTIGVWFEDLGIGALNLYLWGYDLSMPNDIEAGGSAIAVIENPGDGAMFCFTPKENGVYTFYSDTTLPTIGEIDDENWKELVRNEDINDGMNFRISYLLFAGHQYYLYARYQDEAATGSFPVYLEMTAAKSAGVINLDESVLAEINIPGDIALFAFTPEKTGWYSFYSDSDEDTYGYVYSNAMNQLSADDNSGENNNFNVAYWYRLIGGELYYFGARFKDSHQTGAFDVHVEKLSNPPVMELDYLAAEKIFCPVDEPGIVYTFSFTPDANGPCQISAVDDYGTDGYCTIYDANMNILAENTYIYGYELVAGQHYYFDFRYADSEQTGYLLVCLFQERRIDD